MWIQDSERVRICLRSHSNPDKARSSPGDRQGPWGAQPHEPRDQDNVFFASCTLISHLPSGFQAPTPRVSLVAQTVKCLPAMQETCVRSLGQEDPLEKEMATHSTTLAWKIPWTEEPGRLQSTGLQRVGHD